MSTSYAESAQAASTSSKPATSIPSTAPTAPSSEDDAGKKKKTAKRRKVNHACLYCRRSHMTCDEGRPCQRCIKREIGHLCHDERRSKTSEKGAAVAVVPAVTAAPHVAQPAQTVGLAGPGPYAPLTVYPTATASLEASAWPLTGAVAPQPFLYQPETFGNEFSVLTDFLETLDDGSFFTPPTTVVPSLMSSASFGTTPTPLRPLITQPVAPAPAVPQTQQQQEPTSAISTITVTEKFSPETTVAILPAATKTEKFFLTAADQESGSRDERLNRVIRSKYEAGLLKPYNYVNGYARLSRWMDRNVSQESKQQILQPLSVLRPKFRAVAATLKDLDLVFIEEAFERMLLDYDRVFSAMGVPACLWRRTGEIYKGNREFCELIGLEGSMMRDGRLCIYELMAEESAVNYWEKYGHVAFDSSQKAVLTSCVLRYKPVVNPNSNNSAGTGVKEEPSDDDTGATQPTEAAFINCCFSFTIRRDKWGIPSMIVGNFIAC
ncbi:hypothetical protein EST38_g10168 [Candolleomyces aberdarensis]|uniref:Zn(2)-C6 fungal-type domain-containing protein n=1 Tax=Candolleomyces aberdarensis TaxID=2316362 RepID=A0A4Q2D9S9_9AGAR|nr:hypothetical protein EST38_g10168 [Candolleomyces aberdarensis]